MDRFTIPSLGAIDAALADLESAQAVLLRDTAEGLKKAGETAEELSGLSSLRRRLYGDAPDRRKPAPVIFSRFFPIGIEFGEEVDFSDALLLVRAGRRVSRAGWNGKGMWIEEQLPDAHSKMTAPYIYMRTADGQIVPWLCSQTDMLATDWVLA